MLKNTLSNMIRFWMELIDVGYFSRRFSLFLVYVNSATIKIKYKMDMPI